MSDRCKSIVAQLNTSHAAQIRRNREVLKSIIATVEICGCQGIAVIEMMQGTLMIQIVIMETFKLSLNLDVMLVTLF